VFFSAKKSRKSLFQIDLNWQQNRREKVFNREALHLCRGLDVLKFDKNFADL